MPTLIKVEFEEQGKVETSTTSLIRAALELEFSYPTCYDDFDEIRRTNAEVAVVRSMYTSSARDVHLYFEPPADFTPEDEEFSDFLNSVIADLDLEQFKETLITQVPLMGWGFWEIVPGLRSPGWIAPDGKEWESFNNDGLIGIRKLAWRSQSTLLDWVYDEVGEVEAMRQQVYPSEPVVLPLNQAVHLTFGDPKSPTGLSPFQAVSRLKRIKHALEIVQGMGFEHAAGYVAFVVKGKLDAKMKTQLENAAKAIMTAAHGSYVTEIEGAFEAKLIDVTFSAASNILEAIRYYGLMILQIFATHFVAVATTAGTGSYSAASDHSQIYLTAFNAIMTGFANSTGRQIATYLRHINGDRFKNITAYPILKATEVTKVILLPDLAKFIEMFGSTFPMNEADARAIRERSEFLPTIVATSEEDIVKEESSSLGFELARMENKVKPKGEPKAINKGDNRFVTEKEISEAIEIFDAFCDENYPKYSGMLEAKVIGGDDEA